MRQGEVGLGVRSFRFGALPLLFMPLLFILCRASLAGAASSSAIVELFGGERFTGTLNETTIPIQSRFGRIDVPADMVSTLICQTPPVVKQTLTLQEGDVLVGRVLVKVLHLHSADGDLELPLAQISRVTVMGLSEQASTPTTGPAPNVRLDGLGGDQLSVVAPASIAFQTRYGSVNLQADQVRQMIFFTSGVPSDRAILSDGSVISGMAAADSLTVQSPWLGNSDLVIPIGEFARLVWTDSAAPLPLSLPLIDTTSGDHLRGSLAGKLTVQSDFGDVVVSADTIEKIAWPADGGGEASVDLADGRTLHGTIAEPTVECDLQCGLHLDVPVSLMVSYEKSAGKTDLTSIENPPPAPSSVEDLVNQLVTKLSGNGPESQAAQRQLVALGNQALPVLQKLRPQLQPPVRQKVMAVIKRIRNNAANAPPAPDVIDGG